MNEGALVGIVSGTLGAIIGIIGGVLGMLCSKNYKKYEGVLFKFLLTLTFGGGLLLFFGIISYLFNLLNAANRYGLVLSGSILLFVGGLNLSMQIVHKKQIEEFKNKLSKIE